MCSNVVVAKKKIKQGGIMLFMLQVWLYCVYSEVIGLSCCLNKAKTQLPVIHYLVLTLLLLFKKKKQIQIIIFIIIIKPVYKGI